jgi:glycyl-radical enzyme activating protein
MREAVPERGMIFDIQRMSVHDGPGIRTTVFLKGCPLACLWCHNPEGRKPQPELAFTPSRCIGCGYCFENCPENAHVMDEDRHILDRGACLTCFTCAAECYAGALEVTGREYTVAEVMAEVVRDRPFYEESGGGMTLSGGEPLMQPAFCKALMREAKKQDLHVCLETCGFVAPEDLRAAAPLTDLFLFDYKESDPGRHRDYTGQPRDTILDRLFLLDRLGADIILRCPIIPGFNLRPDHLRGIADIAARLNHCREVHVMGYHRLGEAKRQRFGIPAPDVCLEKTASMTPDQINAVADDLGRLGVKKVTTGYSRAQAAGGVLFGWRHGA